METLVPQFETPNIGDTNGPHSNVAGSEGAAARESLRPNRLVCAAFYFSIFTIPFCYLYLPGTGDRVGVQRLAQILMLGAILSQPQVCLRLVPTTLFWFLGYIAVRIFSGLWFAPELANSWWPSSREFIELLPWLWVMFNVLQFRDMRRGGLWALGLGCAFCALFHIVGIGVVGVSAESDGGDRTSVFGMNANELGAAYATAAVALVGLWGLQPRTVWQRVLPFPLVAIIGIAMARTGSRTAIIVLTVGILVLLVWGSVFGSKTRRIAGLIVLVTIVGVILWQIPTVVERFSEINPEDIGHQNPRARMAPVLWEMFQRSPVFGLGPDEYQFELTRRAMPYLIKQQQYIAAHNLFLMLLVETGIVGFLLFALGVKPALVTAWKARFSQYGPLPLALLLPLVIAAFTVCNPIHHLVFWVALAYALAGVA